MIPVGELTRRCLGSQSHPGRGVWRRCALPSFEPGSHESSARRGEVVLCRVPSTSGQGWQGQRSGTHLHSDRHGIHRRAHILIQGKDSVAD